MGRMESEHREGGEARAGFHDEGLAGEMGGCPMDCIAIGTIRHGKWSYHTVVVYTALMKESGPVWVKHDVIAEATTIAKITRLAEAEAKTRGIPLLPKVRHNNPVAGRDLLIEWMGRESDMGVKARIAAMVLEGSQETS